MNNEEKLETKIIYPNVLKKGKFLYIDYIRWVEAIVSCWAVGYGIYQIPFVPRVKWIIIIVLCSSVAALFLHGIKNRSITQLIFDMIKDSGHNKKYSLGSINNEREFASAQQYTFNSTSNFEKFLIKIKAKFEAFDKKYGTEDNE